MSERAARKYYDVIDDPETSPDDLADLYSEDAVLKSPREGTFHGRDGVREFYRLNAEFFEEGAHNMDRFHVHGDTVVCEGTVEGRTSAGRSFEGIGLADVFEFGDNDAITAHRIYLDYSGIYTDLPREVPDFSE